MNRLLLVALIITACSAWAVVPTPQDMRGPFPIMSTPYLEDGTVDYDVLANEAQWTDDSGCPGVIWCQSNDAIFSSITLAPRMASVRFAWHQDPC